MRCDETLAVTVRFETCRLVPGEHVYALRGQHARDKLGYVWIFPRQDPCLHVEQCHVGAQPLKALSQLATDRTCPDHEQPARQTAEGPHIIGSERMDHFEIGRASCRERV